jgi:hypothetical protein
MAVPGINNLHALNTVISSTPATSTNISFSINTIRRNKISYNSVPQRRILCCAPSTFFLWWADGMLIGAERHLGQAVGIERITTAILGRLRLQRVPTPELG